MSKTARLFQLMQMLRQSPPPARAGNLAQEMGVSPRTIYRDIETLRGLGAVIDGEAGFGYTLIEDATLPPLGFDDEEIEALVLGLREVGQVGDPALADAAKRTLAKLKARLPPRQSHRLEHAVLNARRFRKMPDPGVDPNLLRKAAWDETTIQFDYVDKDGRATQRRVDPLGISVFDNAHCLLAYCHMRTAFRAFRLDRMQALVITDASFRPRRVPMLRSYMEQLRREMAKSANPRVPQ